MSDPLTIIHGDAFSSLRRLPDESVQCCVTSPPYWSLRDYGIEPVVWDETVECEHAWGHPQKSDTAFCSICGAWRGCLGLERSEEHTFELQSRFGISYAVFCLKKKK